MVEVRILRADEHSVTRTEDIVTRHSFSFGDHYDPANVGFGRLVTANDMTLTPGAGFDEHPHRGMDIVSWVVSGTLAHRDDAGNATLVPAGTYQHAHCGSGIVHSERNDAYLLDSMLFPDKPLRFVQMWLQSDDPEGEPSYRTGEGAMEIDGARLKSFSLENRENANIEPNERLWLYVVQGSVGVVGVGDLAQGDELRLAYAPDEPRPRVVVTATIRDTKVLVWNL